MRRRLLVLTVFLLGPVAQPCSAQQVGFRASYVSDGQAIQATFRMWTPPEATSLRGAVVLWAGSGQDWRDRAGWPTFQRAAQALGFALIATRDDRLGATQTEVDDALQSIMTAAASASGHAELANAPIALTGFSQGGFRTALASALASERVVGFVGHKGTQVIPFSDAGRDVPALMIAGELDGNFTPDFVRQAFQEWRTESGRAAYAVDWGVGHSDLGNQGWEMAWYWLAEVVRLRYPEASPPVVSSLVPIPLEEGWLGDKPRFRRDGTVFFASPFTDVSPFADYGGSSDAASWLPSEGSAIAYRAFTSSDLVSRGEAPYQTPIAFVAPLAFDAITVGTPTAILLDTRDLDDVTSVALYDGADSLGLALLDTADPDVPRWTYSYVPTTPGVTALTAIATTSDGSRQSSFRTVAVQPPMGTASGGGPEVREVSVSPASPNPFKHATTVSVDLPHPLHVRVDLLDTLGRVVATAADRWMPAGVHPVTLYAGRLASGTYLVRVATDGGVQTQTLSLVR